MKTEIALAALLATMIAGPASAGEASDVISALYARYAKSGADADLGTMPDILDPKLYSKRVGKLLSSLKKACKNVQEICGPDFDFFIDGQDWEIKKLQISTLKESAGKATVEARFANSGLPRKITYILVNEGGRWVIDDLAAAKLGESGGYRLDEVLKPNL